MTKSAVSEKRLGTSAVNHSTKNAIKTLDGIVERAMN